jgi:cytochrome b6-f complex iron-sulfur subunit
MDRKEFLSQLGIGAAGVLFMGCLGGCKKDVPAAPSNVNLSLDLTTSTYSALATSGSYMYMGDGVIVAQTLAGDFIAVSQYCTHEGVNVKYRSATDDFYCAKHGSVFNANGAVTNGPAGSPLKQYTVTKTGNIITIKG